MHTSPFQQAAPSHVPEGPNTELFTPLGKGVAVRPEGWGDAGAARMQGFVDGWVAESSGKGGGLARRPGVISESSSSAVSPNFPWIQPTGV